MNDVLLGLMLGIALLAILIMGPLFIWLFIQNQKRRESIDSLENAVERLDTKLAELLEAVGYKETPVE